MRILVLGLAFLFSTCLMAAPIHKIVVFGDSLSDTGNLYEYMKHQLPSSPPYFEGRFSNGPVWIENVVKHYYPNRLSQSLLNYAFGGSGVSVDDDDDVLFTLQREVDSYLLSHHDMAEPDSLFVIWIGANNYIGMPDDPEHAVIEVNKGIRSELGRLVAHGAKHMMVLTIPDLGKMPAAAEFDMVDLWTNLSKKHNMILRETFWEMRDQYPGVEWIFYDVNEMFTKALDVSDEYGFTNVKDTCYELLMSGTKNEQSISMLSIASSPKVLKSPGDACEGYLFFDPIHPTARAHRIIADEAIKILDAAHMAFE